MKTKNLGFELIDPHTANKEILHNELAAVIDTLYGRAIEQIFDTQPESSKLDQNKLFAFKKDNKYFFYYHLNGWRISPIAEDMVLYIKNLKIFAIFNDNSLKNALDITLPESKDSKPANTSNNLKFEGISGKQKKIITTNYCCWYLAEDAEISIDMQVAEATILIKQHASNLKKLNFTNPKINIGKDYNGPTSVNRMDLISIYKLPETEHLLLHPKIINISY